jgi:pyridoxal 5'-phosphate synthase pdxS subunit
LRRCVAARPPSTRAVGGLNITVKRNAYGRQIDSRFRALKLSSAASKAKLGASAFFIRAPAIVQQGAGVAALATVEGGSAVAVVEGKKMATAFHPEISQDDSWLGYFLTALCGVSLVEPPAPVPAPHTVAPWTALPAPGSEVDVAVKRAFAVFQKARARVGEPL